MPGKDAGGAPGRSPLDQAARRWAMPGVVDPHPGRWLEGPPDVDELLRQVVEGSVGLAGAADGLIWLPEEEGKRLVVRCGTGRFAASLGQAARFGEGLAGGIWERAAPLAVDDYQAWPDRASEGLGHGEVRAVLAAPLVSAGAVVGVLGLAAEPGHRFGEAEVELVRVLGELAGAAVDHAQREHAAHRRLLEQATTEAWLRANELRYRTLIEQIDAVTYSEAFAVGGAQMMYVSPQVTEKLGYTPEEVGQPGFWKGLVHPDDRERVLAEDEQVELTGVPWRMEYRVVGRDGQVLWIRDHAVLVRDGRGRPAFWQGLWIDVTDQKLAEQAMREALELEREATSRLRALDELKNTFLDAVSHELRTPLASVIGIALTLQRARTSLAPADADDLIDRLVYSAAKLDQLLSDLLDLDRLSRGIVAPKLRRTDVAALVSRLAAEWEAQHGRRLGMQLDPVVAWVDPAKVERIVENLLSNAARHTSQATPVWVRVARHGGDVLVAVDDAGGGVPGELRTALFEPFRQGPNVPGYAPGVGIGLSLVARFAELHGGRAWVEDRPGGGSSFRVRLPDPPAPAGEPEAPPEPPERRGLRAGITVLETPAGQMEPEAAAPEPTEPPDEDGGNTR
ncbi:MAG TPA: ATP-binding protein [Actinomycetota bacterium]|nr:ATP-binding protein [Actinomycetota bacterium]